MPRVTLSAGSTPAIAEPTTVSPMANNTVAGERRRSYQKGSHLPAERCQLRFEGHAGCEQAEDRDGGTRTRRLACWFSGPPTAREIT